MSCHAKNRFLQYRQKSNFSKIYRENSAESNNDDHMPIINTLHHAIGTYYTKSLNAYHKTAKSSIQMIKDNMQNSIFFFILSF